MRPSRKKYTYCGTEAEPLEDALFQIADQGRANRSKICREGTRVQGSRNQRSEEKKNFDIQKEVKMSKIQILTHNSHFVYFRYFVHLEKMLSTGKKK